MPSTFNPSDLAFRLPSSSLGEPPRSRLNAPVASASWRLPATTHPAHLRIHINLLDGHWSILSGHWSAQMLRDRNLVELLPAPDPDEGQDVPRMAG